MERPFGSNGFPCPRACSSRRRPQRGGFNPPTVERFTGSPRLSSRVASTAPNVALDRSRCPLLDASTHWCLARLKVGEAFKALSRVTTSRTTRAGPSVSQADHKVPSRRSRTHAAAQLRPADSTQPADSFNPPPDTRDVQHPRHPAGAKAGKARARTRGLSDVGKVAYHKARGGLWLMVSVQNRYSYGTIEVHGVKRGERICTGSFGRFLRFFGGCRVGFGFRLYSARFGFESGLGFFFGVGFFSGFCSLVCPGRFSASHALAVVSFVGFFPSLPCLLVRLRFSCTCAFGGRRVEGQGVGHARPDVPSALRVREVLSIANSC